MGKTEDIVIDYLSQPEIIADLFNGFIFHGEQIILPEMLKEADGRARLLVENNVGQKGRDTFEVIRKERDIVREVSIADKKFRLMLCGVEHQSNIDYSMPLRLLVYDTLEYLKQAKQIEQEHKRKKDVSGNEFLSMFTKEDCLIPTITIIFYTGKEKWDGPLEFSGLFDDSGYLDVLLPYMVKASLNLISIYNVKNTERYHSSLRQIFELLPFTESETELNNYLFNHRKEYSNIDRAAGRLLSLLLDLEWTVEVRQSIKEDSIDMCKAIEEMKRSSKAEGEQGIVRNMLNKKLSPEEVADLTGVPLETVLKIAAD